MPARHGILPRPATDSLRLDKAIRTHLYRAAAEAYLAVLAGYDRLSLHGRSGPRSFARVGVVAPVERRNGIAAGARLQVEAFRRAGMDAELLDGAPALRNPAFRIPHRPATAYVFHSGGPQLAAMVASVLPEAASAWRVAYWAWELPTPPQTWSRPHGLVSEIWAPSEFARASLAQRFSEPLRVVPHAVLPALSGHEPRPRRPFTVLTMADSRSSHVRKNTAGAVRAFCRAFGPSADARLIVKLNGVDPDQAALLGEARSWPNVEVVSSFLDDAGMHALFRSADVLLSLHRAEGFGLPMLEAMAHGLPVVATGWSGNLDFMDASNSVLVDATTVPVQDDTVYSRHANAIWAEPDGHAASEALVRLRNDTAFYQRISAAAYRSATELARNWTVPPAP